MSSESPVKNILKVVFDTNIYISSFLKSGFSREIFNLGLEGKIKLFYSESILLELENKLREKFQVKEPEIKLFILTISQVAEIIQPSCKLDIVKTDPKDNIILECAISAKANLIVSLDKHLLRIKKYQKIGIIHPKTLSWTVIGE